MMDYDYKATIHTIKFNVITITIIIIEGLTITTAYVKGSCLDEDVRLVN